MDTENPVKKLIHVGVRAEAHIEGSSELEEQLTLVHEGAEKQCARLEELREQYLAVLEDFKDLLLNNCGEWFIPQTGMEKLWKQALASEREIQRWEC